MILISIQKIHLAVGLIGLFLIQAGYCQLKAEKDVFIEILSGDELTKFQISQKVLNPEAKDAEKRKTQWQIVGGGVEMIDAAEGERVFSGFEAFVRGLNTGEFGEIDKRIDASSDLYVKVTVQWKGVVSLQASFSAEAVGAAKQFDDLLDLLLKKGEGKEYLVKIQKILSAHYDKGNKK